MSEITTLRSDINQLQTVSYITNVFTDISAAKIKKLRESFKINAHFYEEIAKAYHLVKLVASSSDIDTAFTGKKEKKDLFIVVTSNHRFFGSINLDVFKVFSNDFAQRKEKPDCLVIGKTGVDFFTQYPLIKDWQEYIFEEDFPFKEERRDIVSIALKYRNSVVYYPKFVSIFNQEVQSMDITQTPTRSQKEYQKVDFIIEPEIPKLLKFFEKQVSSLLFQRTMLESELARTAARLYAMSVAEDRAQDNLKALQRSLRNAIRSEKNARLLESFIGISNERFH